jgi:predicted RNase H-like nuclease
MIECYPFTTLVGAAEFGYDVRPRYKRFARGLDPSARRLVRASECDDLIERMSRLEHAAPPLRLLSHPITRELVDSPSPLNDRAYKHREDLLDAVLCAWTAALWAVGGPDRVQILGADDVADSEGRVPTIVAPAKPEQRR